MERLGRLMDDLSVEGNNSDFFDLRRQISDLLVNKGETESVRGIDRILWPIAKFDFSGKAASYIKFSTTVEYRGEGVPIDVSTVLSERHSANPERASFWIYVGGANAISYKIAVNFEDSNRAIFVKDNLFSELSPLLPVDLVELKNLLVKLT